MTKKLNNFRWIERILMKFQDPSNSVQVIFGNGSQISWPSGYNCGPKMAYFKKVYLLPEFLSYRDVTYLFGNFRTGDKKLEVEFGILG